MFPWGKKNKSEPVAADAVHREASPTSKERGSAKSIVFRTVGGIIIVCSLGAAAYFYHAYRTVSQGTAPKTELEIVLAKLSERMELPSGETPTLATVSDREKLASQEFFAQAQNGDQVLIYTHAKKAILFRPSTDKIINVAPVNVQETAPAQETANGNDSGIATMEAVLSEGKQPEETSLSTESETSIRVALYNGSVKIGVTNGMEEVVTAAFPNITVEMKEKAARNDYQGNLIIDLSGKNAELVQNIADEIGGTVAATLPDEETNPGTDILIIVGNK